jgi:hypothetical protein
LGRYVATGYNDFTDAHGKWHVPYINNTHPETKNSMGDLWVGVGGALAAGGGPIIQVGIELSRDNNGVYHYRSWYENYGPAAPPGTTPPVYGGYVTPCHNVSAGVWKVNATHWHVSLKDDNGTVIIDQDVNTTDHPPNQKCAEWTAESHFPGWDLPNFGTVTFMNCTASTSGGGSGP